MRTIPDPGFAGDDGSAAPGVAPALAAYDAAGDASYLATLAVLQDTRVLVPVVAVLGEVERDEHGRAHEKTSDMAAVLMRGRDGRTALLGFTCSSAMARWDPEARPVPVSLAEAARAAVQDEAAALLLDVAGPVLFAVETDEVRALARGERLVQVEGGWGWAALAPGSGDAD